MTEADIIIAGGGPAGCSAALTFRANGLAVAVIDLPGRREKATETAAPQLKRILEELGANAALQACEPCFGIASDWGRESPALLPSITAAKGHAWFIHRARFDESLRRTACEAGALWIKDEVTAVRFLAEGVEATTVRQSIPARWMVLATGSPAWPGRITQQNPVNIDRLIGFWARLPLVSEELLLLVEAADYGWWYLGPGDGPEVVVCLVTDPQGARELDAAQPEAWGRLFETTGLCRRLGMKPDIDFVHTVPIGVSALPQRCGPRWVAAGDAAVKLDPIGSSGVATALASGRRAARAVIEALGGSSAGLDLYQQWSTSLVEEFMRQRQQHYAMEARIRESTFWKRRLEVQPVGAPEILPVR